MLTVILPNEWNINFSYVTAATVEEVGGDWAVCFYLTGRQEPIAARFDSKEEAEEILSFINDAMGTGADFIDADVMTYKNTKQAAKESERGSTPRRANKRRPAPGLHNA